MTETASEGRGSGSLGAYLQEVRESRGLSLEDVSRVTRIGKNYLSAIENNRFDKLPNQAYVKGFLRVYAGYLGIDRDMVVNRYENERVGGAPLTSTSVQLNDTAASAVSSRRHVRWILPLSLIIVFSIAALFSNRKQDSKDRLVTVPAVPTVQLSTFNSGQMANDPRQTLFSSGKGVAGVSTVPLTTVAASAPPEPAQRGLVLRLKITQDSWLNLTIDDSISQQYDLKAGDIIEWKADRVIALDAGNAGGVEGELNGKPLHSLGAAGKPVHLVLKAGQQ